MDSGSIGISTGNSIGSGGSIVFQVGKGKNARSF